MTSNHVVTAVLNRVDHLNTRRIRLKDDITTTRKVLDDYESMLVALTTEMDALQDFLNERGVTA